MKLKRGIFNKRGDSDVLYPTIIFTTLNIGFFLILMLFVFSSSGNVNSYEEISVKRIVLFLDSAKPGSEYSFDFTDGYKYAEKNNLETLGNLVYIKGNKVAMRLSSGSGYEQEFFSKFNKVEIAFNKEENKLIIRTA